MVFEFMQLHLDMCPFTIDMMFLEKQTGISNINLSLHEPPVEIVCAWLGCGMWDVWCCLNQLSHWTVMAVGLWEKVSSRNC